MSKNSTRENPPPLDERRWQTEKRVFVVGVVVAGLTWLTGSYDLFQKHSGKQEPPQFDIVSTSSETLNLAIIDPAYGVIFQPRNKVAQQHQPVFVEFDDTAIGTIRPQSTAGSPFWIFKPDNHSLAAGMKADGKHHVRLRFADGVYSEKITIWFDTQPPDALVRVRDDQENGKRTIEGIVTDSSNNGQTPGTIIVEVFLHYDGGSIRVPMNVERKSYEDGTEGFEFLARVFGLPEIEPSDPQYDKPFFMVYISDQAGNTLFHEMSYAKFLAPGDTTFGQRRSTYIEIEPTSEELGMRTLNFRVLAAALEGEAEQTIELEATLYGLNLSRLEWENTAQLTERVPTIILRNEERIAVATSNSFIDRNPSRNSRYKAIQVSSDGKRYESNVATATIPSDSLTPLEADIAFIETDEPPTPRGVDAATLPVPSKATIEITSSSNAEDDCSSSEDSLCYFKAASSFYRKIDECSLHTDELDYALEDKHGEPLLIDLSTQIDLRKFDSSRLDGKILRIETSQGISTETLDLGGLPPYLRQRYSFDPHFLLARFGSLIEKDMNVSDDYSIFLSSNPAEAVREFEDLADKCKSYTQPYD